MRKMAFILGLLLLTGDVVQAEAISPKRTETVVINTAKGARVFKMEVAVTPEAQAQGLMFRKHLASDAGMMFDFGKPLMTAFWMKDTYIPLDMLFVRTDGSISTIAANTVPLSTKEVVSVEPIRAVIEINAGRSRTLGIVPGDIVHAMTFGNALAPLHH